MLTTHTAVIYDKFVPVECRKDSPDLKRNVGREGMRYQGNKSETGPLREYGYFK